MIHRKIRRLKKKGARVRTALEIIYGRRTKFKWHARWQKTHQRGGPMQVWAADQFRCLTDHRYWARHPEPFNKTPRGRSRRATRQFRINQKLAIEGMTDACC